MWLGLLPIDILPMANSMQNNIVPNHIVPEPILTDADSPLTGIDTLKFSSSEGFFLELLNRGFSSTSEGLRDASKVSQEGLRGDKAEGVRHAPYPCASEFFEYPPSYRRRPVCTPP